MEPEGEVLNPSPFPGQVQFGCGKLLVTGQWHHLTVTVAKEAKKSCIVSAYINGQMVGSAKVKALCIDLMPDVCLSLLFIFMSPCAYHDFSLLTWETQSMMICIYNTCRSALWLSGVRNPYKPGCIFAAFQKYVISLYWCFELVLPLPLSMQITRAILSGDAHLRVGVT